VVFSSGVGEVKVLRLSMAIILGLVRSFSEVNDPLSHLSTKSSVEVILLQEESPLEGEEVTDLLEENGLVGEEELNVTEGSLVLSGVAEVEVSPVRKLLSKGYVLDDVGGTGVLLVLTAVGGEEIGISVLVDQQCSISWILGVGQLIRMGCCQSKHQGPRYLLFRLHPLGPSRDGILVHS
jgi:hypothetical protein